MLQLVLEVTYSTSNSEKIYLRSAVAGYLEELWFTRQADIYENSNNLLTETNFKLRHF